MPGEWRGTRLNSRKDFPILVKFMFPREKLSIQVHPDDAYAAAHEQAAARAKRKCGTQFPRNLERGFF